MKKALVLGGTRGIGGAIGKNLKKFCDVTCLNSKNGDTSSLSIIDNIIENNNNLDIVVLNKDSNNPDPLTIKKNDLDWGGKNNKSDYKKIGKYLDKYGLQNLGWVKNPHHKDRVTDKKSPHYDMYEFGDYGHIMPKGWEKSEALTDYLYHKTPDFEHKIRTGRGNISSGNISTRVPIFQ